MVIKKKKEDGEVLSSINLDVIGGVIDIPGSADEIKISW